MKFGEPITTKQAAWAILELIDSPIVGNLRANHDPGLAIEYCTRPEVYNCLSSGEKRLVCIAWSVWSANEDQKGGGVAALGGLDHKLRSKVWLILGYLYLGRDVAHGWSEWDLNFA